MSAWAVGAEFVFADLMVGSMVSAPLWLAATELVRIRKAIDRMDTRHAWREAGKESEP